MSFFNKKKMDAFKAKEKREKKHTIMVVDDEDKNLKILVSLLQLDYHVITAIDGLDAYEQLLIRDPDQNISLIISDQNMPRLTGTQLFERILPIMPNTQRIIITAYTDIQAIMDSINKAKIYKFILKPYEHEDLLLTVRRALEAYELHLKVERHQNLLEQRIKERTLALEQQYEEMARAKGEILSGIRYARRIQSAILPLEEDMVRLFPDSFVLYLPRDIVSGDFYWLHEMEDYTYLAAVDCTGHGVPGAFLSMIGHTLLNKIIREGRLTEPSEILDRLDQAMRRALRQDQEHSETRDGMDLSLCRFSTGSAELVFASARQPLLIVHRSGERTYLKGDKRDIGGRLRKRIKPFHDHHLTLEKGDTLYLFTDGFPDQGGAGDRKYGSRHFREFLFTIAELPMSEQRQRLLDELKRFMGEEKQRDDITVLGVRM